MSSSKSNPAVQAVASEMLAELHAKAGCERIGVTRESFSVILCEVGTKYGASSEDEARTFFLSLRVDELALARACAAGENAAWEIFLTRYREKLYLSALRIAREDSAARELADTLYADLYGTHTRDGQRVSKLAPDPEQAAPGDNRLAQATDEVLTGLSAGDRIVLSAYYLDERTLAEIAGMLGVHESTISRKLDKLAKSLRKQIIAALTCRGMSRRQAEEAMELDVRDLQVDIRHSLAQESPAPAFSEKRVEARIPEGEG